MTTDDRLAAIRVRAEAATDGPWLQLPPWKTVPTTRSAIISPNGDIADRIETEEDAEFVAHAREDVPYLLDEVERLREYIDRMPYPSDMDELRADRDRLAAAVERVRALDADAVAIDPETQDYAPAVLLGDLYAALKGDN